MARRSQHWYSVSFSKGSSSHSYMLSAACKGNAIAMGWTRLEDTRGTREGWSLSMVSTVTDSYGGNECGCKLCTPDEVDQEALDINTQDTTTVEYLMFQEFDLECTGYSFPECPWDSEVGRECMRVFRKTQELLALMPDIDCMTIWTAAFEQCEVFYCG